MSVKADQTLPSSGSREDHLTFLSSLRSTRDTVAERRSTIGHELNTAYEVAKLQELRLTHATNTLDALEDIIGEVRVRFRARGIPLYPAQNRHRISNTESVEASSGTMITSGTRMAEEVNVSLLS